MIVVQFLMLLEDVELSVGPNIFEILDNKINISPIPQDTRLFFFINTCKVANIDKYKYM